MNHLSTTQEEETTPLLTATQVTKTNQTLFSSILSPDSTLLSSTHTSSVANSDENFDGYRSRLDSASSDISQTPNYVSPSRQHIPPSDIESEYAGDESDHETNNKMNKLLSVYKNKFSQLKNAYDEVERERDNIKKVLQEQQDTYIKRQKQSREALKHEQQAKEQVELTSKKDLILRDHTIEELTQKLTVQKGLLQSDQEEIQTLREKTTKFETLLTKCKETIKTHQEKQLDLVAERDRLSQQLTEKQTIIESMTKDCPSDDVSLVVKEQEQAVLTEASNQRYEEKSTDFEQLLNEKINLEKTNEELQTLVKTYQQEIEQHVNALDILKTEYENLTNDLNQTTEVADVQHQATLNELQDDYNESQASCSRLTESLETLREEQLEFDRKSRDLHEENDRLQQLLAEETRKSSRMAQLESDLEQFQSQANLTEKQLTDEYHSLKEQYQQTMESNVSKLEQLTKLQEEFNAARKRLEDELEQKDHHTVALNATNNQFQITIEELQTKCETYRTEIVSLVNVNEENTRRLDELAEEKFNSEQELEEKTRQITERDEKVQEIELTLKQAQDSGAKLRKALQNITADYEQRSKEQETDYQVKLKAMAKEMSSQIEAKEQSYNQQLKDFIDKNEEDRRLQAEIGLVQDSEAKINGAEKRALFAEEQMLKIQENLQEKQLDHHRVVQDLQDQVASLTKIQPVTTDHSSQTQIEDFNHPGDGHPSFVFEPTEVDYLKQIVLAYMTGTDRITMAKVICAVLRYNENEKSQIIEHEKLRQTRWLNSPT